MADARKTAVSALLAVETDQAYSNLTLGSVFSECGITGSDRSLATALFYGVLDRKITLDYILSKFVKTPLTRLPPFTLTVLRVALYQLLYLDRIPQSAAVNEAVRLMKSSKERYQASFVNAVLRNILRNPVKLPEGNAPKVLSVRYSCDAWLIESLIVDYGEETAVAFFEDSLKTPPVNLRVNLLRTNARELAALLERDGMTVADTEDPACLTVTGGMDPQHCAAYHQGLFHVQDTASQKSIAMLAPKPGERLLDLCAAPGGKSFTMAELMHNEGELWSLDLYEKRVGLIRSGAKRLGLSCINAQVADASEFHSEYGEFDAVLCDVPCSGYGVLRRKPELKYKPCTAPELIPIQRKIFENGAAYVKPGGRLMYSTCTLHRAENEENVQAFLDKHTDFALQYEHTYFPQTDGTDGFYCALFQRKAGESSFRKKQI